MFEFDKKPIEYEEYAKNHFRIKCTNNYFNKEMDQSILNKGHYFIEIIDPHVPKGVKAISMVWSDTCGQDADIRTAPLEDISFETSTVKVHPLLRSAMDSFKDYGNYWQIEIVDNGHLYIMTAPNKPQMIIDD